MTFTYNPDLTGDAVSQVRAFLGDTNATAYYVEDETIAVVLALQPDPLKAAGHVAATLAARGGAVLQKQMGDLTIRYQPPDWSALATSLSATAEVAAQAASLVAPYAGGISEADKRAQEQDSDRVQPVFARDLYRRRRDTTVGWCP